MTTNDSADPRWLEIYATLLGAPPHRIVDDELFEELGALDLWEWAVIQRGPIAANRSPWLEYTEGSSVSAVRAGLPVWTGILALHPTSAVTVQRLARDVGIVRVFAEHACQEWDALLDAGADGPFPTSLAYVPRDGDWETILAHAQHPAFVVPRGTTVRRIPPSE